MAINLTPRRLTGIDANVFMIPAGPWLFVPGWMATYGLLCDSCNGLSPN